jgi:hypothetical protein
LIIKYTNFIVLCFGNYNKKATTFPASPDCSENPFHFFLKMKRLKRKAGIAFTDKAQAIR